PAADEHEGALRAQAAQADRRHAERGDRLAGALFSADLRQAAEDVLNTYQARLLDVCRVHTGDRADGDVVRRLQQARAGDDDLPLFQANFERPHPEARVQLRVRGIQVGVCPGAGVEETQQAAVGRV